MSSCFLIFTVWYFGLMALANDDIDTMSTANQEGIVVLIIIWVKYCFLIFDHYIYEMKLFIYVSSLLFD